MSLDKIMYWTGTAFLYVKAQRIKGAIILMYHSIASSKLANWIEPEGHIEPSVFESQMRFLANHRNVISLNQLLEQLKKGQTPCAGTVVLTFDDGYLDNMTVAASILAHYKLPATWYLPTGMIYRGENPWIDRIYTAFKTKSQTKLSIEGIGSWDLVNFKQQLIAYDNLKKKLIVSSFTEREDIIANVIEQLQPTETPSRLILSWDEIRKVMQKFPNIEMGIHSTNHVDFTSHSQEIIYREIQQCIADFRHELGRNPRHFAFPYNRHNAIARELVQELGLTSAVAHGSGREVLIQEGADLLALPRIEPPHSATLFRLYTSGAFSGLLKAFIGRVT
ncbi:polysaccharide deacetylase family protein [Microcoleus sp. B3-A4]|uniref:polysaccharide deacetylase family protein n=1 Tax=Microcoleus sp. B3-A4 TaxID=2818653 RepID=UPI002FD30A19